MVVELEGVEQGEQEQDVNVGGEELELDEQEVMGEVQVVVELELEEQVEEEDHLTWSKVGVVNSALSV